MTDGAEGRVGPAARTRTNPERTMDDAEFLERFERGTLDPAAFRHADHVRAAWLMLRSHPGFDGLERYCAGIRGLARAARRPGLYHETITWAYLLLIRERMARMPEGHAWEDFASAQRELFAWNPGVLDTLYRAETLRSDLARRCFVLPDRAAGTPPETRA